MEMVDGASMLWRLHLRGADVGKRWTELANKYETMVADAYYPFNDAHAMMAFVATGRDDASRPHDRGARRRGRRGTSSARLIRDIGLPVVRAIRDFGDADYEGCFDTLLDIRKRARTASAAATRSATC